MHVILQQGERHRRSSTSPQPSSSHQWEDQESLHSDTEHSDGNYSVQYSSTDTLDSVGQCGANNYDGHSVHVVNEEKADESTPLLQKDSKCNHTKA